jgi:fructan beta-fructosidase
MKKLRILVLQILFLFVSFGLSGQIVSKEYKIEKRYLNFPVEMAKDRQTVKFLSGNDTLLQAVIRISETNPDYWVFKDVSAYYGKVLKLLFPKEVKGIDLIYQSDRFAGQDSLYKEVNRPQFHFTSKRGWNNDPNGLVYQDGEYHLFYQHNPYESRWENMHWGHAVSKDLIHWNELNDALYPDKLGMMYSGSAVIDKNNTSGFGKDALVAIYTAAGKEQTQCIAYSTDKGRTFTKYEKNPVLGGTRDPKVFWYEPAKYWVMVLYRDNVNSIYTSKNLKEWTFRSETKGFFECPEMFELAVNGDTKNRKWVMYGASGTYMIGSFDGVKFTPEYGKYFYSWGSQYAAQTYNNIPDGRRIQIGWGQIEHPGMPFSQMMLFPCELTLRTTPEGVRLFCEPVKEIENLFSKKYSWQEIKGADANEKMKEVKSDLLHVKMNIEIVNNHSFEIRFKGEPVLTYDGSYDRMNGAPYPGLKPGAYRFDIELLLDRTSVEVYIDKGKLFISQPLKKRRVEDGLNFRGNVMIHSIEINEMKSIW